MISLNQLQNKLNNQAKSFALLMEFPILFAEKLWANGVYTLSQFSEVHEDLKSVFNENELEQILEHKTLKYLMINEFDDQEIIDSLHTEIEMMASRIENQMLVDIETLELVSVIYKVLGLDEEAKFIVNTGADFTLEWRPYFDAFNDPLIIQYADLIVHGCYYRLIATKFPFEKISLNTIKRYMHKVIWEHDGDYEGCISRGNSFSKHEDWLTMTLELFNSGKVNDDRLNPTTFEIEGGRYLIYGFPLNPSLVSDWHKPELALHVKNLDGEQKFIIRIDQQQLIFYARRVDKSTFNTVNCNELIDTFNLGVLSHFDADDNLLEINRIKYLTCFRPYSLEDMKGVQV